MSCNKKMKNKKNKFNLIKNTVKKINYIEKNKKKFLYKENKNTVKTILKILAKDASKK